MNARLVAQIRLTVGCFLLLVFGTICSSPAAFTLVPTLTPRPTDTPVPPPTPLPTHTPTATASPQPTISPTPTPRPSRTPTSTPFPEEVEAQVVEVIDGNTIKVIVDGQEYTVRYIGIDTPEMKDSVEASEWLGPEATEANKEMVAGTTVLLEKDVSNADPYGRLLRYVYAGGVFVNEELVRLGFAQISTHPPDVKYFDTLMDAQREARDSGRGLWSATPTPSP